MLITQSVDGVPIRLTTARWEHICRRHPDLQTQRRRVIETIRNPAEVLEGDFGAKLAARFYRPLRPARPRAVQAGEGKR